MKTRVIVAVIGIPILVAVIFFAPGPVFGCVVGLIAAVSAVELMRCAELGAGKRIIVYTAVSAAVIPVLTSVTTGALYISSVVFLLFAVMLLELMLSFGRERRMDFETVCTALIAGAVMPLLLSSLIRLGFDGRGPIFVMIPLVTAFSCDSGAYFAGTALGRTKLVPAISPNKTVEGAIGGFLSAVLFMVLYGLVLRAAGYEVKLLVMAIYGFLGGLACQIGDLSFSAIKRMYNVKDYGNIIPGHGGMLDRFDSMFFVAPMILLLALWVPAISGGAS